MDEKMDWIRTVTDCPPGERHALRMDDEDIPISHTEMRKGMEAIAQSVRAITDANGGLRRPIQALEYVPHPFTEEDAEKAVGELAAFAVGFGKKVPENLTKYMIGQDKMESRVRDMILETIAEMSMSSSADERSAADAMILSVHKQFRRSGSGLGSQPAAGAAGRRARTVTG